MADHFGVVKALLDANLLPRVIAGTSCGSLIAAFVCTRTDEELKTLLNPSLAKRITACEEPFRIWVRRFLHTGARFDTVDWARKASNVRSLMCPPADLATYRQYSGPEAP
jgi:predicted acylesterase/phospholipase RssA